MILSPISIAFLAFSMSADACAAAAARGAATRPTFLVALRTGLVFGVIEAFTPLAGWAAGRAAGRYVADYDHWIALILLAAVGGRMAVEALAKLRRRKRVESVAPTGGGILRLVATAVATSIDAAAVGVTLAFAGVDILLVAAAIGLTTFLLTTAGQLAGRLAGEKFGPRIELAGGLGLVGIGASIFLAHGGLSG